MAHETLASYTGKPLAGCTDLELFNGLLAITTDAARTRGYNEGKKKLYYISAEFLIGKLLAYAGMHAGREVTWMPKSD